MRSHFSSGMRRLKIPLMVVATAGVLLFSGCANTEKKKRLERENPGCTYIEEDDALSCEKLPWAEEFNPPTQLNENLSAEDIEQLSGKPLKKVAPKKAIKKKAKSKKPTKKSHR